MNNLWMLRRVGLGCPATFSARAILCKYCPIRHAKFRNPRTTAFSLSCVLTTGVHEVFPITFSPFCDVLRCQGQSSNREWRWSSQLHGSSIMGKQELSWSSKVLLLLTRVFVVWYNSTIHLWDFTKSDWLQWKWYEICSSYDKSKKKPCAFFSKTKPI